MEEIKSLLTGLYSPNNIDIITKGIETLWDKYKGVTSDKGIANLTEKDVVLITYGDQVSENNEHKLKTLQKVLRQYLKEEISIVHVLPFYPYTSDDGFSIIDYYAVNKDLGSWSDIEDLSYDFRLLFDAVINHNSSESGWFKKFIQGNNSYKDYYVEEDVSRGYDKVVRPRTTPLTHRFESRSGAYNIWTTFSRDQVDLNYKNPQVLLHILDLLFFYVSKGSSIIRLDAVGFLWKEKGTSCIHLEQTHKLIKLMRKVIEKLYPSVMLLTETNVPHKENISYFGNGDEAHMVYNFTLPPLLAYSILNETTEKLSKWISELEVPHANVCYFNFLASHDGVGVMPVQNILNEDELKVLIYSAEANGGKISYKTIEGGEEIPYEINCNYLSLLFGVDKEEELGIKRSLLAHAILLTMPGLPAIYFHSIFGSINDLNGMEESGQNRRINREKFKYKELISVLDQPDTRQARLLNGIRRLIAIRKQEIAFDPYGNFNVLDSPNGVLYMSRNDRRERQSIYGCFNLTQKEMEVHLGEDQLYDIITSKVHGSKLVLEPLSFVWLKRNI